LRVASNSLAHLLYAMTSINDALAPKRNLTPTTCCTRCGMRRRIHVLTHATYQRVLLRYAHLWRRERRRLPTCLFAHSTYLVSNIRPLLATCAWTFGGRVGGGRRKAKGREKHSIKRVFVLRINDASSAHAARRALKRRRYRTQQRSLYNGASGDVRIWRVCAP